MTTVFPASKDSFDRPTASSSLSGHAALHDDLADAIEKIEDVIGVTGDTTAGTVEKRLADLEGTDFTITFGTGSDLDGSITVTNLGNVTNTTVAVRDDSHNHIISNVDGLQTALDGKLGSTAKAADSNKLDDLDSTQFLRSDTSDSFTGSTLTFSNADLRFSRSGVYSVDLGVSNSSNANRGLVTFFSGSNQQDVQVADLFYGGALQFNSSITLKENVNDFTGATEIINQLRPVTWEFIADDDDRSHVGLIAEEVRDVFPLSIGGDPDCPTINQSSILGLAIAGLCEANARITALEAQVASLQGA
jgi:hypothetical protein